MLIQRHDLELQERYYLPTLKNTIFIHPTDTFYGIGCNARNSLLVMRLRVLKKWHAYPFTVIAPNKDWIRDNMDIPEDALKQLPGPVTIIGRLKNPGCVSEEVHLGHNAIGVRIPNHWMGSIVERMGVPIVSTCANKNSECLMTSLDDADPHLVRASSIVIHEGSKEGQQAVIIDYTEGTHWIST